MELAKKRSKSNFAFLRLCCRHDKIVFRIRNRCDVILVTIQVSIVFAEDGIGTKYLKVNFALLRLCCGHNMTVVRIQNGC